MDTLAPFRRYFRYAALACTIASAGLTAWFGINQSPYMILALLLAAFLVACSIASDYINLFVVDAWRKRDWGTLGILSMGAAFVFSLNLMSNLGSVGWQKEVTATAARVHNTKVDDVRDDVAKAQADYDSAKRQYDTLTTANAWAASANATSLRAMLAEKQAAADREASRVKCGPKCEALKLEVVHLTERIGVIERRADLTERLNAAKSWLARAKAKAETKDIAVDAGSAQAAFFSSLVSMDLKPSDTAQTWTSRAMSSVLALGLCFAPMLFSYLGWRGSIATGATVTREASSAPVPTATITPLQPAREVMVRDASWSASDLQEKLNRLASRLQPRTV